MEVKQQENEMNLAFASSDFYQMLSLSLQFPSKELAIALLEGTYWEDGLSILEDLSCSKQDIHQAAEDIRQLEAVPEEELYKQLRQEYTRLFNDPKNPRLAIYESLFLYKPKEKGEKPMLFLSPEAIEAEKSYKEAGVKVDKKFGEPADHMATELEFLMVLYANKGMAIKEQNKEKLENINKKIINFYQNHLGKWGYEFFERLEAETTMEHFRVMARIAKAGLNRLKEVELSS
jgi:TorA maturation chaperone TorD